jgi:hypothetical protein
MRMAIQLGCTEKVLRQWSSGESNSYRVCMRKKITGEALSWDEMKRTSAQRPRYSRSGSMPYFSAVPTNWFSQK